MKNLTIFVSLLMTVLNSNVALADMLLIPDSTISIEQYASKCQLDGYSCTQKYFYEQQVQQSNPLFDKLIDSIDLSNKNFVDTLPKSIVNILQKEMISLEQLEMLMRLLEQTQDHSKEAKSIKQLTDELTYIQNSIPTEKNFNMNQEKFIVFFKKPFSVEAFKKIKKSYLNLPYAEISFNQLPVLNSMKGTNFSAPEALVTGICEKANIQEDIKTTQWKIMSDKSCSWSESLATSTSGFTSTIKENKGWLITGAVLIGAAILASQYEVKFQF